MMVLESVTSKVSVNSRDLRPREAFVKVSTDIWFKWMKIQLSTAVIEASAARVAGDKETLLISARMPEQPDLLSGAARNRLLFRVPTNGHRDEILAYSYVYVIWCSLAK